MGASMQVCRLSHRRHASDGRVELQLAAIQRLARRIIRLHVDLAQGQARERVCIVVILRRRLPIPGPLISLHLSRVSFALARNSPGRVDAGRLRPVIRPFVAQGYLVRLLQIHLLLAIYRRIPLFFKGACACEAHTLLVVFLHHLNAPRAIAPAISDHLHRVDEWKRRVSRQSKVSGNILRALVRRAFDTARKQSA